MKQRTLSVFSLSLATLFSATIFGPVRSAEPAAAATPVKPSETYPLLKEPVLVMSETAGFRPLHLSICGRYAAIVAAKPGTTRIYLYDTKTQKLELIANDAKTGIQIVWGHLHYKSGQVAVNDRYVAYIRENGARDQLILREITNPEDAKIYDLPDGMSLGQMSVGNDDSNGFGVIGYKRPRGNILDANVYYLNLTDESFRLIHASSCDVGADPKNSWLYNRGPQTRNGTMTWIFGSHDCVRATSYYWDGSFNADGRAKTKALPLSMYTEKNVQNPSMITMFDEKIYMYAYNIQYQSRAGGLAAWDPVKDTLTMLGDGLTPSVSGRWLLLANPNGIFKIDTTATDPWKEKRLVIPPAPGSNHYTQSGARLSCTGRFVYFRMDNMDGANTRVYMADVNSD